MSEIEMKLRNIFKENLGLNEEIDNLGIEDDFQKITGVNSITFIKIAIALEIEFGFEFDDDQLEVSRYRNLKSIIDYVQSRL